MPAIPCCLPRPRVARDVVAPSPVGHRPGLARATAHGSASAGRNVTGSSQSASEQVGATRSRARGLCSKHWRRAARAAVREKPPVWNENRRANKRKREALKKGAAEAEAFSYLEVFERDGWICQLCSDPVDPDLVWPHPLSKSLDHIVPLAKGGSHRPENGQCSHLVCNTRKGDRLVA